MSSEYRKLKSVLLYRPGAELSSIKDPSEVQHLEKIDAGALGKEFDGIAAAFRKEGIRPREIPRGSGGGRRPLYNLMYVRDLFFMTPKGAVLARMAGRARPGEERHAGRALKKAGVPILKRISGAGRFEGADALWLDEGAVVCAVGGRTNAEGFRQLRAVLEAQGVSVFRVPASPRVLHLLGLLQIVDERLALIRKEIAPAALKALLRKKGFRLVSVPENDEAVSKHGMNVVVVGPRRLIMSAGCPRLRRLYRAAGLKVVAEAEASQLVRGGGGLACATGILARES